MFITFLSLSLLTADWFFENMPVCDWPRRPLMRLYCFLNALTYVTPPRFSLSPFQTVSAVLDHPSLSPLQVRHWTSCIYLFIYFYKSENSCVSGTEIILSNFRNPSRWISLSISFINKVFPNWFWHSAVRGTTWERPAGASRFLQEGATPTSLWGVWLPSSCLW